MKKQRIRQTATRAPYPAGEFSGRDVYRLRVSLGLTQDGLAARLHVRRASVCDWERGGPITRAHQLLLTLVSQGVI